MPKVTNGIYRRIVENTKKELGEKGYHAMNVRTVAQDSIISTGTIYNYFPAKINMADEALCEEWQTALGKMDHTAAGCPNTASGIAGIYRIAEDYMRVYGKALEEMASLPEYSSTVRYFRRKAYQDISEKLKLIIDKYQLRDDEERRDTIAQILLACVSSSKIDADKFALVVYRCFPEKSMREKGVYMTTGMHKQNS